MVKKSTGIYISNKKIYMVQMSKALNKPKLLSAACADLPEPFDSSAAAVTRNLPQSAGAAGGRRQEGVVPEQAAGQGMAPIEGALRNLLKKHGIARREIISTALPPDKVVTRYFQMPRLSHQEQSAAVPFEARKYLPYKLDDISCAYDISFDKVPSNKMAVTFVAAEKASVTKINRLFNNIDVRIGYLETVSYSLMRLLYHTRRIEELNTVVVVYAEQDNGVIILVRNRVLYLTRNVSFSGKAPYSSSDGSNGDAGRIKLDVLMSEIRLSLDYFHRQFPEEKIQRLYIWTDEDGFKGHAGRIQKELNINTEAENPLAGITSGEDLKMEYSIACGLAMKRLFEPHRGINLSPGVKKIEVEKLVKSALAQTCVAITVLLFLRFLGLRNLEKLEGELDEAVSRMPKTDFAGEDISLKAVRSYNERLCLECGALGNIVDRRVRMAAKIDRISESMPQEAWIRNLSLIPARGRAKARLVIDGSLYISGADDYIVVINKFLEDLKTDPQFNSGIEDIVLSSISKRDTGMGASVSDYQISCVFY